MADVIRLDGTADHGPELLGGKAWGLNRMAALGLPVPPAFVIPTTVQARHGNDGGIPDGLMSAVRREMDWLSAQVGRPFGCGPEPLLAAVRSGAATSMPGMMDTVLNIGLTPSVRDAMAAATGSPTWTANLWDRLVRAWSIVVDADSKPPDDVDAQLSAAIAAVFTSWDSERARAYRARRGIAPGGGTAVTIQAMVFGNRDDRSGTGVLFSRHPGTGERTVSGEWLPRAQGTDLVAGVATPRPLDDLAYSLPDVHRTLLDVAQRLEDDTGDMVGVEFTVESGTLHLLQYREGKRSPRAAVRIAVDLVAEGRIDRATAVSQVTNHQLAAVDVGVVESHAVPLVRGAGASDGVATGSVATDTDDALDRGAAGEPVVLVREQTSPSDVPAMFASVAVVTARGGTTSHAALLCREAGLPCVVGAGDDVVESLAGRRVTVDGGTGAVYDGEITAVGAADLAAYVDQLRAWAGQSAR